MYRSLSHERTLLFGGLGTVGERFASHFLPDPQRSDRYRVEYDRRHSVHRLRSVRSFPLGSCPHRHCPPLHGESYISALPVRVVQRNGRQFHVVVRLRAIERPDRGEPDVPVPSGRTALRPSPDLQPDGAAEAEGLRGDSLPHARRDPDDRAVLCRAVCGEGESGSPAVGDPHERRLQSGPRGSLFADALCEERAGASVRRGLRSSWLRVNFVCGQGAV